MIRRTVIVRRDIIKRIILFFFVKIVNKKNKNKLIKSDFMSTQLKYQRVYKYAYFDGRKIFYVMEYEAPVSTGFFKQAVTKSIHTLGQGLCLLFIIICRQNKL